MYIMEKRTWLCRWLCGKKIKAMRDEYLYFMKFIRKVPASELELYSDEEIVDRYLNPLKRHPSAKQQRLPPPTQPPRGG